MTVRYACLLLLVASPLALGCSVDSVESEPEPDPGPVGPQLPDPICTAGTAWSPGTLAFADATSAWGLADLGVTGVRLSAVDYDGDGFADLIVRHASDDPDQSAAPPACCATASCPEGTVCPRRRVWLLHNNGAGGFEDVTHSSGILQNRTEPDPSLGRPSQVFAFADVDNDGDLDAYTGRSDQPDKVQVETSEIMLNQGDGTFALGPADSHVRWASGDVPAGASFVDYDRNGVIDLWVTQSSYGNSARQDQLYQGSGTGLMYNVTEAAGLLTQAWDLAPLNQALAHTVAWSALACDLNGDGNAELLSASYGRAPNHLWQATGPEAGCVFANRSIASGYAFDDRTDWTDNESARCYCKLHPTAPDCAGVPEPQYIQCNTDADAFRWTHYTDREPFRLGGNSAATICADVNNDGHMDLLTTEIVHWDVGSSSDPSELLLNTGEPAVRFERPGNEVTGLVREHAGIDWNDGDMTGAIFDFDNDGWPDVYIGSSDYPGTRGLLFQQNAPGHFQPVDLINGIDHHRSHGIAVADFDRDGDLDVVVGHSRARCSGADDCYDDPHVRLFENQLGHGGNWVQLTLVGGEGTNRAAIGARVTVTTPSGLTQTQEVGGGHGHYGAQHDLTLHFGLGADCEAEVTVRWPDAQLSTQTFDVVSGYRFAVEQGQEPEVVPGPEAAG